MDTGPDVVPDLRQLLIAPPTQLSTFTPANGCRAAEPGAALPPPTGLALRQPRWMRHRNIQRD
ncbi:MAG: hypothetical protein JO115_07865 [Pseudonocardiales bacterium]|nr:hypothetical protein [Pseudonocardiales bacterium]